MKKINNILIVLFSIISLCLGIYYLNIGENDRIGACFTIFLSFVIPKIIRKIFKVDITDGLEFTYIIFIIMAQFFGSVIYLYNSIWWFDLLCHFLSGVLTSVLAVNVIRWFKAHNNKKIFKIVFILCFSISIAAIWEYIECLMDIIFNTNVQHYIETGVKDTISDMLIATIGSIIFNIYYYLTDK